MVLDQISLAVGKYKQVRVTFGRYPNGNTGIVLYEHETGIPLLKATAGIERFLPPTQVAIKDWLENEGLAEELKRHKIIEQRPAGGVSSGFVFINIYKLHPECIALLQEQGFFKEQA